MDIEDINKNINNEQKFIIFFKDLIKQINLLDIINNNIIDKIIIKLRHKYKINSKKKELYYIYNKYFQDIDIKYKNQLELYLIKTSSISRSGVLISTIVLEPSVFSCSKKCSYCPTETDINGNYTQPKSYLSTEPAMRKALIYNFNIEEQLKSSITGFIKTGNIKLNNNNSYKLEIIISGGTFDFYKYNYREEVMNKIYYAANTYDQSRDMLSIEKEITINETAKYRIIGLTIETRPDCINLTSIKNYRRWGVTRVQLGVQHYDDEILKKINRECYTKDTINAIKLLKQTGFKIVCHLMPDLPFSNPVLDSWMFKQAIENPDLQFDDVKIYPTAVCQSESPDIIVKSDILDWYNNGKYIPYAETNLNNLINILIYYKTNIQPWIRIQRLIRDIPRDSILVGYERISNLRQIIKNKMNKLNLKCNCIRCMEIGDNYDILQNNIIAVRKYKASEGDEYFISIEINKNIISYKIKYIYYIISYYVNLVLFNKIVYWSGNLSSYNGLIGFCRLRLDKNSGGDIFDELKNTALIRELHVYGHSLGTGQNFKLSAQHKGYGQLLIKTAENIAIQNNYKKIAIIAGVGSREYYKNKCNYILENTYMIKYLNKKYNHNILRFSIFIPFVFVLIYNIIY